MKVLGFLSAIATASLSVAYGQAIKDPLLPNPVLVSARLQLVASLEQASVRIGDPIKLHYRLKNLSSGVVDLVIAGWNDDYWLMVTDASGTELPRTKEGDRMRRRSTSQVGSILGPLEPGADDGDQVTDVAELYQLDRPGNYFVRIARRLGLPPGEPWPKTWQEGVKVPLEEAVSDLIPFTIAP